MSSPLDRAPEDYGRPEKQTETQIFLGGTDYSGIKGHQLTDGIVGGLVDRFVEHRKEQNEKETAAGHRGKER